LFMEPLWVYGVKKVLSNQTNSRMYRSPGRPMVRREGARTSAGSADGVVAAGVKRMALAKAPGGQPQPPRHTVSFKRCDGVLGAGRPEATDGRC
jgi:hypothetical protein